MPHTNTATNYPAGVNDNHPHFDMPDTNEDAVFCACGDEIDPDQNPLCGNCAYEAQQVEDRRMRDREWEEEQMGKSQYLHLRYER